MAEVLIDQLNSSANGWTIALFFFIYGMLFDIILGIFHAIINYFVSEFLTRGRATSPLVTKSKK